MKKLLTSLSVSAFPMLAFAVTTTATDAFTLLKVLQNVVDAIIPFVVGLAVLVFIYGVFNFVTSAGDEEARAGAKQLIIWGIIGIFVMVSVWGLVNILSRTFNLTGITQDADPTKSTIPLSTPRPPTGAPGTPGSN